MESDETLNNIWKKQVFPILEVYADRLPGAFVEEKESSMVWHYRAADPELGQSGPRNLAHSHAKYYLSDFEQVKVLLKELSDCIENLGTA